MSGNPLGENVPSPSKYDPGILYAIPRWAARSLLDIDKKIPMHGIDHWHAYELSWLNEKGKPQVAVGEFFFDADSENIVESKSLKLYLNSFNQERFASREQLGEIIKNDLSAVSKSGVRVRLLDVAAHGTDTGLQQGKSLDGLDISITEFEPAPQLLRCVDNAVFDELLTSDLFKSNCPVTAQPDWASVAICYTGAQIEDAGLLAYLCSYRGHQGYHEECAERIYRDIMQRCAPAELRVAMNFVRRGGLDINVYRSSEPISSESVNARRPRQ